MTTYQGYLPLESIAVETELDFAEVRETVEKVEVMLKCLLPILAAHGIHITAQDMSLFRFQVDNIRRKISDLEGGDQGIISDVLRFYKNKYEREEY